MLKLPSPVIRAKITGRCHLSSEASPKEKASRLNRRIAENTFAKARTGNFIQAQPEHQNAFTGDPFLIRCLKRIIPNEVYLTQVEPDLIRFGSAVSGPIWKLGRECEEQQPVLKKSSPWGRITDEIVTCDAWKEQKKISAREGLIAIAYERQQAEFSRVYQVAKLMLYSPASGLYSCPLAMTDGAAKTIETLKPALRQNSDLAEAFTRLTSRDPEKFWTSGQWMTEKQGGSDVARGTETLAVPQPDGSFRLYGYKWFSSATDSDMTLTLGRIVAEDGTVVEGTPGVSMFFARTKDPSTLALNGIEVMKMKNKLGTRQLPTAELLLDGCQAHLISDEGRGIASISNMLTITRLHNVAGSVACQRKILQLARDYAKRRSAFGDSIEKYPLHLQTLSQMETDTRGCTVFLYDLARQMGLEECGLIDDQDRLLLRLMMPVAKMFTAKKAVANVSEGLECFGGQGYIEDTGLPTMLRDAQVFPIWEGTSNVMALDVLRAIAKTNGESLKAFAARISEISNRALCVTNDSEVKASAEKLLDGLGNLSKIVSVRPDLVQSFGGRDFAFSLANVYIGGLLLDHALVSGNKHDVLTVHQWTLRDLTPIATMALQNGYGYSKLDVSNFVFEGYE